MKDGGPAFPQPIFLAGNDNTINVPSTQNGMSLREWFAGMAMQGICARGPIENETDPSITGVTKHCYRLADAMLKERDKP